MKDTREIEHCKKDKTVEYLTGKFSLDVTQLLLTDVT